MKFSFILGTFILSHTAHASLVMNIHGKVTAQYEIDKNNIAEEVDRSFKGSGQVDAHLFGEQIKRSEVIEKDLSPSTHFTAPKNKDENFEIPAVHKVFVNAAKEILAPYVAKNRRDGLHSKVQYRFGNSTCQRFAQSIVCETRLWARLQGAY